MLENSLEDAIMNQLNEMKLIVEKLQSEKGVLEEACEI
jgi:hypothetical protein